MEDIFICIAIQATNGREDNKEIKFGWGKREARIRSNILISG